MTQSIIFRSAYLKPRRADVPRTFSGKTISDWSSAKMKKKCLWSVIPSTRAYVPKQWFVMFKKLRRYVAHFYLWMVYRLRQRWRHRPICVHRCECVADRCYEAQSGAKAGSAPSAGEKTEICGFPTSALVAGRYDHLLSNRNDVALLSGHRQTPFKDAFTGILRPLEENI